MTINQKTSQQFNESLSALMDGEASELEIRRIMKSDDLGLNDRWHRYQLASSAMRGDFQLNKSIDLSAGISAAIADEPAYSKKVDKQSVGRSFWSNFGRFGIAASVAGAVVIGVQLSSVNGGVDFASTPAAVTAPANGSIDLQGEGSVSVVGTQSDVGTKRQNQIIINEKTQQKLQQMEGEVNRLMLEHAQDSSQHTQQGLLPFVRVPDSE